MTPILAQRIGTDRSFEKLYRKHAGDVYRYALVVLRNQADAEDVTQTTFLNAYRAIENGERPRSPQNWLIAIAHNVCRQRFRQSQRRPNEVAFEDELAEAVVDEDTISAEDIRRALGHLAFNQRAALVMRELEGRSYQEIAEILDVSVSAVETLIFRARRALREQLEEGITCHEAELSISRQLDGRLARKDRGALRAHLRECEECSTFARSQRAQRGALKSLAAIPLPHSLVGLFGGGGGGAAVGGGIAVKAAAVGAGALLATGVGYEGVHHGILRTPGFAPTPSASKKQPQRSTRAPQTPVAQSASVVAPRQEARHDQKPFRKASVKARRDHRERSGRSAAFAPERLAMPEHKEVSPLPPSRVRGHDPKPTKPEKAHKPVKEQGNRGSGGSGAGNGGQENEHKPPKDEKPSKDEGKAGSGGDEPQAEAEAPAKSHGDKPSP
jgi:RNA polymerase sigma factor (sigma-70 family)